MTAFGDAVADVLIGTLGMTPRDLPRAVADAAARMGSTRTELWLCDLEQRVLRHFAAPGDAAGPDISVEDDFAGRAYREERWVEQPSDEGRHLWLPILDSAERLGSLSILDDGAVPHERWVAFASLVGEVVTSKGKYGDDIERLRRVGDVSLAAEMRWALLPPLTFTSPDVTISGILQPALTIAGDAFDYAVNGRRAEIAVFDAMGHGLEASRIANLVVGSYRNSRRRNADLAATLREMDETVAEHFGEARFATVAVASLDLDTGELRVLNAGHPPPVLLRAGTEPEELATVPNRPVGLGTDPGLDLVAQLEPGDVVVLHTDGITEATSASGEPYGEDRLRATLHRRIFEGHRPAEALRLLIHEVLDFQASPPRDDGSLVLMGWRYSHSMVPGGFDVMS